MESGEASAFRQNRNADVHKVERLSDRTPVHEPALPDDAVVFTMPREHVGHQLTGIGVCGRRGRMASVNEDDSFLCAEVAGVT